MKTKTKGFILLVAGIAVFFLGAVLAADSASSAAMILLLCAAAGVLMILCGIYLIRRNEQLEEEKKAHQSLENGKAYRHYRARRITLWITAAGVLLLDALVYAAVPYQIILIIGIIAALIPLLYSAFHPYWKCPYCGHELPLTVSSKNTFLPAKTPDLSIRKCPKCGHKLIYPD